MGVCVWEKLKHHVTCTFDKESTMTTGFTARLVTNFQEVIGHCL